MNSPVRPVVLGVGGTALAGLLAGWLYGNSPIYQLDPGALFDPRNLPGSIVVAIALFLAVRALRPFSGPTWRLIWIAGAVLYPICIFTSFHAITGLAQHVVRDRNMQRFQDNFRLGYGRDATPQEIACAQERIQQQLDEMPNDPNMGHQAQSSVTGDWFWGPVWVSVVAGVILKTRGYRLKNRLNLDRFIEKTDDP